MFTCADVSSRLPMKHSWSWCVWRQFPGSLEVCHFCYCESEDEFLRNQRIKVKQINNRQTEIQSSQKHALPESKSNVVCPFINLPPQTFLQRIQSLPESITVQWIQGTFFRCRQHLRHLAPTPLHNLHSLHCKWCTTDMADFLCSHSAESILVTEIPTH